MRGWDLGVLIRARRFRFLSNLIGHLPRDSFFVEAVLEDEEYAEAILAGPLPESGPRTSEWSPLVEYTAQLADLLKGVQRLMAAFGGVRTGRLIPTRRPYTAFDRAKERKRIAEHNHIAAIVLGPRELAP